MGKEILVLAHIEIEKHKFYRYKSFIFLDIDNVFCPTNLPTIKIFQKSKDNLMVVRLKIFMIKKSLRWTLIIRL